ncbi:MAG: cell division protein ZapA [Flavobacteriales bacterium]|mgnify:CR=1 FL=1|jgi:cell division protein ZapA (FtsZ GTPase activity inhibitor)|nr:cell division protein ZapA [Flavobacteriales bacterium]MBP7450920.1 cell division protein ZapA [Flavobacteriales bacterium]
MEDRSIRIELAGRAYPLTIGVSEELNVRRAVDEINESIARLKANYPLTDKQDLLAMAALEVTVRALNSAMPTTDDGAEQALAAIERMLNEVAS